MFRFIAAAILLFSLTAQSLTKTELNSTMILAPNERSGGSGFFVVTDAGNSYIITNAHVCEKNTHMHVYTLDNKKYDLPILFKNDNLDLCAIKSPDKRGFKVAKESVDCGEYTIYMGYPELRPFTVKVAESCDNIVLNQVFPGNSGSPVLNLDLEVIGIVEAHFKDTNMGYFVNLTALKTFLKGK
jgi:serine protease Do